VGYSPAKDGCGDGAVLTLGMELTDGPYEGCELLVGAGEIEGASLGVIVVVGS
jgi:hypothetical protein